MRAVVDRLEALLEFPSRVTERGGPLLVLCCQTKVYGGGKSVGGGSVKSVSNQGRD